MGAFLLIAASGLAREAVEVLRRSGSEVLGFLDDNAERWGTEITGLPVLGGLEEAKRFPAAELVLCAGRGSTRQAMASRLAELAIADDRFGRVIAPDVAVPSSCTVGRGSILLANVALTTSVAIGRHVVVMPNATLTHDDVVEDYATICAGVSLGGNVTVGEAAYLGMNSSVRERASVGADAVLGMGAVLVGDQPPSETWVGVPARPAVRSVDRAGAPW